jgi:hypothetical protein
MSSDIPEEQRRPMVGEAGLARAMEDDTGVPLSEGDDTTGRETGTEAAGEQLADSFESGRNASTDAQLGDPDGDVDSSAGAR